MDRRRFLVHVCGMVLAVPAVLKLTGCEGDVDDGGQGPGGGAADDEGFAVHNTDASGHLHEFSIRCVQRGADGWMYTATGAHTHQVWISAEQLATIFAGGSVTLMTTDLHPHTWIVQMPPAICGDGY